MIPKVDIRLLGPTALFVSEFEPGVFVVEPMQFLTPGQARQIARRQRSARP